MIHKAIRQPNPYGYPNYVVVEDYTKGNYINWCNNYGYISANVKGMVGDLQLVQLS